MVAAVTKRDWPASDASCRRIVRTAGQTRPLQHRSARHSSRPRPLVGVPALQGDVREHLAALEVREHAVTVRRAAEPDAVDGLVIPGGESTTMSHQGPSSTHLSHWQRGWRLASPTGRARDDLRSRAPSSTPDPMPSTWTHLISRCAATLSDARPNPSRPIWTSRDHRRSRCRPDAGRVHPGTVVESVPPHAGACGSGRARSGPIVAVRQRRYRPLFHPEAPGTAGYTRTLQTWFGRCPAATCVGNIDT